MLFALIWPFDWSCSGFVLLTFMAFAWFAWAAASAAQQVAGAAKDVLQSDTANEIGKSVLEEWIASWFRK